MIDSRSERPLPTHLGIIMDGNGRWAERRGLPRTAGHERGAEVVHAVVRACRERGIPFVTLYAFSHLNWGRPRREVEALMDLLPRFLDDSVEELHELGVRLRVAGEVDDLPPRLQGPIATACARTAGGEAMTLTLALSYGARRDVVQAMRNIAVAVRAGTLLPEQIDEELLRGELQTAGLPDLDLVIRTAGEMRLSDFLMLEAAHAELYFTDAFWPDFDDTELDRALGAYARRVRRFGGVTPMVDAAERRSRSRIG
ncbi:MAG: di-trans,poly-cis-decaprenylcistransferase [Deltaproteobacteria bacterium]|nr:di-trans,poly-cis-decaprenylcistransferase [Deltaproteobacteria bacterium]